MNLRKKSRSKLRIFGSFSTKLRLHRSETDLRVRDKSTPVLLGVKHHSEVTTLPSPRRDTESKLASRSFSVSCTSPRQTELAPVSLLSLPISPPINTAQDTASLSGSNVSDVSHTDSGAFSCVSSPSPCWPLSRDRLDLPPLLSPPLVLSVSRRAAQVPSVAAQSGRVTVTVGGLTRLCINDTDTFPPVSLTQYQSLPNLNTRTDRQTKLNKMPRMGLSRLVNSPSKLPTWQERSRITTSTAALLSRSNTMDSRLDRTVRESSCCSDTSSGVFSETGSLQRTNRTCYVTVNGQLL